MSRNLQAFNTNRRQFETGVLETKIFPFFLLSSKCANDFDNKISDYTFTVETFCEKVLMVSATLHSWNCKLCVNIASNVIKKSALCSLDTHLRKILASLDEISLQWKHSLVAWLLDCMNFSKCTSVFSQQKKKEKYGKWIPKKEQD